MTLDETEKTLLNLISDIIAEEFIKLEEFGVCLLVALIFSEQAKKLYFKPVIKCGKMDNGCLKWPVHFWTEIKGEIFDPTVKITNYFISLQNMEYYENQERPNNPDDFLMLEIYQKYKKSNKGDLYFKLFPSENAVRQRINEKMYDIFGV